jgi:hypothetical protein
VPFEAITDVDDGAQFVGLTIPAEAVNQPPVR